MENAKPVLLIEIVTEEKTSSEHASNEDRIPLCSSEPKTVFHLNEPVLKKICNSAKKQGATRVAVISIAGIFREGKSFLLNFFLDYLYRLRQHQMEREGPSGVGQSKIEWLMNGKIFEGFVSRRGVERVTTGLWIWNEPVIVRTENGYRVAVFLIDTQGILDKTQSFGNCAALFALSTMMSSIQIYNVMKLINESHLQSLSLFSDFGRNAAEKSQDNGNSEEQCKEKLQNLVIAVRDYQFAESFPHGGEGGLRYWNTVVSFSEGSDAEGAIVRSRLENCFNRIGCYLLPHPGLDVTDNPNFNGQISSVNPEFLKHVKTLVEETCDPSTIETKRIDNINLTPDMFYEHVNNCVIAINDDSKPLPMSLTAANSQMRCYAAAEKAKNSYRLAIARQMCFRRLSPDEFKQLHDESLIKAVKLYQRAASTCESEECIKDHEKKLEAFLNDEYEMLAMNLNVNDNENEKKNRKKPDHSPSRSECTSRFVESRMVGVALLVASITSSLVLVFCSNFATPPDLLLCLVPVVCVTLLAIWCFCHIRMLCRRKRSNKRSKQTTVPLLSYV